MNPPRPPAATRAAGAAWLLRLAPGALLLGLVVLAYLPALRGGFVWDDDSHLTANPCIIGPLGLRQIWTTAAADYFPLTLTSFWTLHALFGLTPWVYHAVSILLHALGALVLWRVLVALRVPGAWFGAALWAIHPVQVESVAWIAELKNTQSCLFYLFAVLFFVRWIDGAPGQSRAAGRGWGNYALALACTAFAILSKTSTVMLPPVLLLVWWWRRGRPGWRALGALAPFFALAVAAGAWTIWEQQFHSGASGADWNQSVGQRLIIAGRVPWFYLGKLLWPHPLVFIYPRWAVGAPSPASFLPWGAAGAVLAGLWWRRARGSKPVLLAAAYFGLLLFPVLGFFRVYFFRYAFVADHFQYLASMGPLVLLAAAGAAGATRITRRPWLAGTAAAAVLTLLGALTWRQCGAYADDATLWRATLAQNPGCWLAYNNLGAQLGKEGRVADAIAEYRQGLRWKPDSAELHGNLGLALAQLPGRLPEAIDEYEASLRYNPAAPGVHCDLGAALGAAGRLPEAVAHFQEALRWDPRFAEAHCDLGLALEKLGQPAAARAEFEAAIAVQPTLAQAHNELGNILIRIPGRLAEAVRHFEAALGAQPDSDRFNFNLGIALLQEPGQREAGIAHIQRALALNPRLAIARQVLDQVAGGAGQPGR